MQRKSKVRASVLCPGYVKTRIMEAERNRPAELQGNPVQMSPEQAAVFEYLRASVEAGISPQEVTEILFKAIREERLYVNTHPELNPRVQERMNNILQSFGLT